MVTEQLTYPEALEQLRAAYEQEKIQLTAKVSSLEVTVGQQSIEIKKLQETVEGDLTTCSIEAWDLVDEQVIEIKNLQMDVKKLQEELDSMDKAHSYIMDDENSLWNALNKLSDGG